jgi:glycopeptide antibiotics resistance protein
VLSPVSRLQSRLVEVVVDLAVRAGAPADLVTYARVEVVANVVMVVPLAALAAVAFRRPRWQDWAAYGFVGSLAVELVQGFLLPGRSPSATDVVANTAGMLVGAVLGGLVRRRGTRHG